MKLFQRMPFLLYSYLATEMLAPFFASFLVMNAVFILVKLIPFLNFVLALQIGFTDFIRLLAYLFPSIFLYTLPMAAMLGITIGFARLSGDGEILALKAGGISMYRILPPVIIVASLIALLTCYFSVKMIPASEIAMKQLTYQILKEKVDQGVKEHKFTEALGDLVLYVDKIDQVTGEWQNVWVSDMRGVTLPTITMAQSGTMKREPGTLNITIELTNGSLHRQKNTGAEIVTFDKYTLDIPINIGAEIINPLHKRFLSMTALRSQAQKLGLDTQLGRTYLIEYHKRLVLPVGCLMLSFLALPLGLQARAGKKAIGIPVGLGIFIIYYILHTVGKELAESGTTPLIPSLWFPNIFFFALAMFWISQVTNELPLIPEKISCASQKFWDSVSSPLRKMWGKLFPAR